MKSIETTAKTTEDAISAGLEQLGVSLSDVKVEIVEEGSKGLFGLFGSRPAKVRMTVTEEDSADEVHEIFANSLSEAKPEQPEKLEQPAAPKAEPRPAKQPAKKASAPKKKEAKAEEKKAEPAKEAAPAEKPAKKPAKEAAQAEKPEKKPAKKAEQKKSEPKKSEPKKEVKEVKPAEILDPETLAGKAQDFLGNVTRLMGVETQVHMTTDEEGFLHADLQGDTSGILIGRRGETLDALQHLTSLYINKGKSDYTRITLDTENYRARREDTLIRLANRYANRAVKTGRRVSVEPMNPYERRIMHSALQENELVDTHSEGEEPNRHIVITPRKQGAPREQAE